MMARKNNSQDRTRQIYQGWQSHQIDQDSCGLDQDKLKNTQGMLTKSSLEIIGCNIKTLILVVIRDFLFSAAAYLI